MTLEPSNYQKGEVLPAVIQPPPIPVVLQDSPKSAARIGYLISFGFFVVLLGWAAVARLDAAAFGVGQVSVSGNRQTVQHRDGGTVEALNVREGQHVSANDVLVRLTSSEIVAQERAYANTVIGLMAQKARLEAEINGTGIVWPAAFSTMKAEDSALATKAMGLQTSQLTARLGSLAASQSVLRQQAAEIRSASGGFKAQNSATEAQRESLKQQLDSTRELEAKGYASRNTVRSLERALSQLEGSSADFSSRESAAGSQIAQTREQALSLARKHIEESASQLRDTQFQLNELEPKWVAMRDELDRVTIRAPVTGKVVGLKVFSVGGVVAAGQPILDIVPDAAPLIIKANFSPGDIDGVREGREAEVKFLSLHERDLPILLGTIRNVSADSLTDEKGNSFFTAEIVVPDKQLAMLRAARGADTGIRAGVPVQVVVKLRKRTALQYMIEPLTEAFNRSLHER